MIQRAGRRKPGVAWASPVGQPPRSARAASSSGPAAEKIAPHTPPPRVRPELAAFTIASTASRVMSPCAVSSVAATDSEPRGPSIPHRNGTNRTGSGTFPLAPPARTGQSSTVVITSASFPGGGGRSGGQNRGGWAVREIVRTESLGGSPPVPDGAAGGRPRQAGGHNTGAG